MKVTPLLPFDPALLAKIEVALHECEPASRFIETSVAKLDTKREPLGG